MDQPRHVRVYRGEKIPHKHMIAVLGIAGTVNANVCINDCILIAPSLVREESAGRKTIPQEDLIFAAELASALSVKYQGVALPFVHMWIVVKPRTVEE